VSDDYEGSAKKLQTTIVVVRGGAQSDIPLNECWAADLVVGQVSRDRLMELSVREEVEDVYWRGRRIGVGRCSPGGTDGGWVGFRSSGDCWSKDHLGPAGQ
jgi:hypothetical protein